MIPDRDEDIKPRFHKTRVHTNKHNLEDGEVEEDDEDGLDDDDSSISDWNLRLIKEVNLLVFCANKILSKVYVWKGDVS